MAFFSCKALEFRGLRYFKVLSCIEPLVPSPTKIYNSPIKEWTIRLLKGGIWHSKADCKYQGGSKYRVGLGILICCKAGSRGKN